MTRTICGNASDPNRRRLVDAYSLWHVHAGLGRRNDILGAGAMLLEVDAAKDKVPNGKVVDSLSCPHDAAAKVLCGSRGRSDDDAPYSVELWHLEVGRIEACREHLHEELVIAAARRQGGQGH